METRHETSGIDLRLSASAALFMVGEAAFWVGFLFLPWRSRSSGTGAFLAQLILNAPALVGPLTTSDYLIWAVPLGMVLAGLARIRWSQAPLLALVTLAACALYWVPNPSAVGSGFWLAVVGTAIALFARPAFVRIDSEPER